MSEDHTHRALFAPVCDNGCGFTLRLFRDRDGSRCSVAFTTPERLAAVLGSGQGWVELAEPALRDMVRPLGVRQLVVDPNLIAPPVKPHRYPHPQPQFLPQPPRAVARPGATLVGATGAKALPYPHTP
ncbi:SAV_915 family protein [Streptacidiphilus sp. N1-12]|uniref:SAV_915 family protein n=2 Tax=Streptacidiphilus alkalitolerans TaxID=3342712 RepID=A0ABV6VGA1_9ACTN